MVLATWRRLALRAAAQRDRAVTSATGRVSGNTGFVLDSAVIGERDGVVRAIGHGWPSLSSAVTLGNVAARPRTREGRTVEDLEGRTTRQIEQWAADLIDLSGRNATLFYKGSKRSSLRMIAPEPLDLVDLVRSSSIPPKIYIPANPARAGEAAQHQLPDVDSREGRAEQREAEESRPLSELVERAPAHALVSDRTDAGDLRLTLRAMARQTEADYLDRGLQTLYVAVGMLQWRRPEETKREGDWNRSPLVYVPVWLQRPSPREDYRLSSAGEEVVINPALRVVLQQEFGIELETPEVDPDEPASIDAAIEAISAATRSRGWRIDRSAVLMRATFHKEAMHRDLLENIDAIAAHPLVQTLAVPGAGEELTHDAALPSEQQVDDEAPPEEAHLVLDADASQRRAIAAAASGASIVMDGPPGTGKSQTIANLIAELMAQGKRVLFVSEKSAALDVVADRLAGCGLDEFLLQLHDHKTRRRDVATELGRSIRGRVPETGTTAASDTAKARDLRERLTHYAEAMNRKRQPLDRSLHWVLGRLAQLHDVPRLPPPEGVNAELSADQVADLHEQFDRMARRWQPAVDPDAFVWAHVRSDGPDQDLLQRTAGAAAEALQRLEGHASDLARTAGLPAPTRPSDTKALTAVVSHTEDQPWTEPDWWQRDDHARLIARVEELAELQDRHERARRALAAAHEDAGASLDGARHEALVEALERAEALNPRLRWPDSVVIGQARSVQESADQVEQVALALRQAMESIEPALGLPSRSRGLGWLDTVLSVAEGADAAPRPEAGWALPATMTRVEQALDEIEPLQVEVQRLAEALEPVFTPEVLDLDLLGLSTRFAEVHVGLRKLSSDFRNDKRTLSRVARTGRATPDVRARLEEARAWQDADARLRAAQQRHASLLGPYQDDTTTQIAEARQALERLSRAREQLGNDYDAHHVAAQLAGSAPDDHLLGARAAHARESLAALRAASESLLDDRTSLNPLSLSEVAAWARSAREVAATVEDALEHVRRSRRKPVTLGVAKDDLAHRATLDAVAQQISAREAADRSDLGTQAKGLESQADLLKHGLQWSAQLVALHGGPLPDSAVAALHGTQPVHRAQEVDEALAQVDGLWDQLVQAFAPEAGQNLRDLLASSLQGALEQARTLRDRSHEIREWRSYRSARRALAERGWTRQLDQAEEQAVSPDQLAEALERAMWLAWTEALAAQEPGILGLGADDLDDWVLTFRRLDRTLLDSARERTVRACNQRRPRSELGAASIIAREATKKRKHMPIRSLLEKTQDVALALKPCFMMSPLTVSQFLPRDIRFDTVVFDEASQVRPEDAINCIYRGEQLIVTGDDKQLPPTHFFDRGAADSDSDEWQEEQLDEFESIITQSKGAAGMPSLPLRWHYRSQHEDLITFSNYQYYAEDNQALYTFPGARATAEDLGVQLYVVDGVYRRGGPRDNPREAEAVAARVREHAARILEQPESARETVGVVAFSVAQAEAIEHRIDQLRRDEPQLEDFFTSDRLQGFFVKNLESVQGDERDIMIFSVGYGPDEHGKFTAQFGPLSGVHGHRRLNVAITRARKRVEVVCSFAPSQLNAREATYRGVPDLKRYLEYAQQGTRALGLDLEASEGDVESPFEQSVLDAVRRIGYEVVPQVGSVGYRIDLGVRDPNEPDRFALGIECDGAAYHSTRVARDRDRLRAQVLEGLGWRLHRIWGPSWYQQREREVERLRVAIEEAIEDRSGPPPSSGMAHEPRPPDLVMVQPEQRPEEAPWATPYRTVELPQSEWSHPSDPGAFREVASMVLRTVQVEQPVHVDLVARRIAWAYDRNLTRRVRQAVDDAAVTLKRQGRITRDGEWLWSSDPAHTSPSVRTESHEGEMARNLDQVHPAEIREAMLRLVEDAQAIDEDTLISAVGNLFGVQRLRVSSRSTLEASLAELVRRGGLERTASGMLRRGHGSEAGGANEVAS